MLAADHPLLPGETTAPPQAMLDHWSARLGTHTGPLDFWKTVGLGSRARGFFNVPDPEWLTPTLDRWLGGPAANRTPLAYTGLGDILYFRDLSQRARDLGLDEETIRTACDVSLLDVRYKRIDVLAHSMDQFLAILEEPDFIDQILQRPLFHAGLDHAGELGPQQILGFVPMLALGGSEAPENLQPVGAEVHWDLLLQA